MSVRSNRASSRKPNVVASTAAAASPAPSPKSSAPSTPVIVTVPSAASVEPMRANSVGPASDMMPAASQ